MVEQQSAHLPPVPHFLDHHTRERPAIPVRGRGLEEMALLLHGGKLGVTLVDDHVQQRIAHLLGGDLAKVLPLAASLVGAELDFVGLDGAVKRVEFEAGDLVAVDANFLAPLIKQTHPITEGSDFCNFAWHTTPIYHKGHEGTKAEIRSCFLRATSCPSWFILFYSMFIHHGSEHELNTSPSILLRRPDP